MTTHTLSVTIGGASAAVAGPVRVEREENKAAIASVTVRASGGNPESWIRQALVITYDGTTLFSGKINRPSFDAARGLLTLTASDLLQEYFEARTEAQILSDISQGVYSSHVFGDREDGWQQAMDVLSTWPGEVHLNAAGTLVAASWVSPGGNTHSIGNGAHIAGTVRPQFARGRDLVNKVELTAQVRYTRRHHREHAFSWSWGHAGFCDYFQNTHDLPTRDMIQSAADGAGWPIQGPISFTALPPTGNYACGAWAITDEAQRSLAAAAGWTATKRWTQTVTETFKVTVQSATSIARYGETLQEDGGSYQQDYDSAAWDADTGAETPTGGAWSTDAIGDRVSDEITRADANAVIDALMRIGKTRILETHRRNFVTWDMPLDASLDLADNANVTIDSLTASGKLAHIVHQIDPIAGRAVSSVKIACFRGGGGSDDAFSVPSPPDTAPTHTAPTGSTSLQTRIGGVSGAPAYDANWTGYTGNSALPEGGAATYPNRFRVVTPDIEDDARNEVTAEVTSTLNIAVPDDTISVSAI